MEQTAPIDLEIERRIALGKAAEALKGNDLFQLVASRVISGAQLAATNTMPDQKDAREQLYWLQRGVNAFIDELAVMVNDAKSLEAKAVKAKRPGIADGEDLT